MGIFWVVQALWALAPAYAANMTPVFAAKVFPRWNARIDAGRTARDGRPLLGEGKTWRGLVSGAVMGGAIAVLFSFRPTTWGLSDFGGSTSTHSIVVPALIGTALGAGALVGDAVKSYFKRRTGRSGGKPWVPFDQLDFVVGSLAFAAAVSAILASAQMTRADWFSANFLHDWHALTTVLVLTPLLHLIVNMIGFRLGLKKVPW